jgi:uncharacterized phage-associated protein
MAKYDATTIAKWFLAWADYEEEGALSNLKLQKLLYYAQGHHLARAGLPLFDDHIQAWAHGPVVPTVYRQYSAYGSNAIPAPDQFDFESIDASTHNLLASLWETHGSKSAWKLREMTHSEAPWRDSFREEERNVVIPVRNIQQYFAGIHAANNS